MRVELVSQYSASLKMMGRGIELCPDDIWCGGGYRHRTWHVMYHALFYCDLYSCSSFSEFKAWKGHIEDYHSLGPMIEKGGALPNIGVEYSKADIKDYLDQLISSVPSRISANEFHGKSGFPWLPMNRFELHLYNLRHIQHHIGQLNERYIGHGGAAVGWI